MTPIHIFRASLLANGGNKAEELTSLLLSAIEVKKKFGKISLFADNRGVALVQQLGIPYDNISHLMETAEDEVSETDAQIIGFQKLHYIQPDYLYIDHKVPFNEAVEVTDFFVHKEQQISREESVDFYKKKGVEFFFNFDEENIKLYDVSIFKCNIPQVLGHYFESYFTSLYKNKDLFNDYGEFLKFSKFLQQSYLYKVIECHGLVDAVTVFEKQGDRPKTEESQTYDLLEYALSNYPKEFAQLLSKY